MIIVAKSTCAKFVVVFENEFYGHNKISQRFHNKLVANSP